MTSHPHRRRALAAGVLGLAVTAALTGATQASAPTAHGSPAPRPAVQPRLNVTLITGDVVTVETTGDGHQAVTVRRPAGAIGGVRTYTIAKDTYVIPDEAMPFVAAKTVDRRLFDVSALIRDGYDDAHSDGVPLLLSTGGAKLTLPTGIRTTRVLPSIRGAAVNTPKSKTRALWKSLSTPTATGARSLTARATLGDGVTKVYLDGKVKVTMAQSNAQIGTAAAWAAGYDGTGVKVAVLDTGYDTDHPDLVDRVSQAQSFVPDETVEDGNSHGTHTLSTVGGSGAASGGQEKGVAPGADLMVGKVLSDEGYGQDSWILAGMEWAAHAGAKVISMSLGTTEPFDGTDIESVAVDQLTADTGALFVIAAGNSGCEGCIGTPGAADSALTVGAVDSDDQLAWFSSLGPRYGDYGLKPDIVAPGVGILAAKMGGDADTGWYQEMDGTSMATPHVAGVAALLLQEHPDWKAQQVKDAIMSTALQLPSYTAYQVGAGRVSVPAAVAATVTATGSQYFGFFAWPHTAGGVGGAGQTGTADADVDKTVTFTNTGATDVTLHLGESAEVAGGPYDATSDDPVPPVGDAAPAGMFTLASDTVTVPAHSTASVVAHARPSLGTPGTRYLGKIVATDAGGTVLTRTNVGLYLEDQRYTLDLKLKDRAGKPLAGYVNYQKLGTWDVETAVVDDTGVAHVRWRAGTYQLFAFVDVQGDRGKDSTGLALLGVPELKLDHDMTLTLDARQAVKASAVVPASTEPRFRQMEWYRNAYDIPVDAAYLLPDQYDDMYVLPTRKVTIGDFEYDTRWRLAEPILTVTDGGKPMWLQNQFGTGYLAGTRRLAAVYAGTSDHPLLGKVKGKVAVLKVTGDFDAAGFVTAAAAAGARMVLLANTLGGKLYAYVGTADGGQQPIPVASIPTTEATKFLARVIHGGVILTATGTENTPFVYDLQDAHPGYVPTHLTYQPKPSSLATVDMRFYGTTATSGGEFRWDYRPFRTSEFAFAERQNMPGTRVDHVSTEAGTGWYEDVFTGGEQGLESRGGGIVTYDPGQRVTRDWFSPVVAPRNGTGFWLSNRDPYGVNINLQPWSDGGDGTAGYIEGDAGTVDLKVLKDGTLVDEETLYASGWIDVSADTGPSTLTFDLTATRSPAYFTTSTSTHTVWQVKTAPTPNWGDLLPVLQMDYAVRTDLAGRAAGGLQSVGLTAYHLDGAVGTGKVGAPRLQVSFDDGTTWKSVEVAKADGGGWVAVFHAPTHGFVSLRATVTDSAGNSVDQTVIRAYGLK